MPTQILGHSPPDERRDLANALLRAALSAVLVETRTLLVDADPDVVGAGP